LAGKIKFKMSRLAVALCGANVAASLQREAFRRADRQAGSGVEQRGRAAAMRGAEARDTTQSTAR
jgi:hypothetical protein